MSYTPKAQRTRSRILDRAAERMFAQGYSQLKLDDVLLDAQVRKGNFYYYFASKDDLCLSVLKERARPLLLDWIEKQISPVSDPWQNLAQLTQAFIDNPNLVPEQGNPLANLALEMAMISEEFPARSGARRRRACGHLGAGVPAVAAAGPAEARRRPAAGGAVPLQRDRGRGAAVSLQS